MSRLMALFLLSAVPVIIATVPVPVGLAYPGSSLTAGSGSIAAGGAQVMKESGKQEDHDNKHLSLSMGSEKGSSSSFNKAQGSIGAVAGQGQVVHQQQNPWGGWGGVPHGWQQPVVPGGWGQPIVPGGWGQPTHPPIVPGGWGQPTHPPIVPGGWGQPTRTPVVPGGWGQPTRTPVVPGGWGQPTHPPRPTPGGWGQTTAPLKPKGGWRR